MNPDGTQVPPPQPTGIIDTKKRLVSEFYDEIVFHEPSQLMQQMLNTIQPVTGGSWAHDTDCKNTFLLVNNKFFIFIISITVEEKKVKSLEHIIESKAKVKNEINVLKDKLQQTREKIAEFKEMAAAQQPQ